MKGFRGQASTEVHVFPKVTIEKTKKPKAERGFFSIKGTGNGIDTKSLPDFQKADIESVFKKLKLEVTAFQHSIGGITETHALYVPNHSYAELTKQQVIDEIVKKMGLRSPPTITHVKGNWKKVIDVVEITFVRRKREPQHLGDYLNADRYWKTKGDLIVPLGKANQALFIDLSTLPHLLITGTSGSGKSESLNGMILSIHHRYTASDVQFAFIDPKLLELSTYENSPLVATYGKQDHRKNAFFTKVDESISYLESLVEVMERRYRVLLSAKVKNIKQYHEKKPNDKMPYLICVIDEFAKLVEVGDKDRLFSAVKRLTAEARASGIILILATQTPRAEVLPGQILGNLLTRVIFKTGNKTESDQVLKVPEASFLQGKGDGIYVDSEGQKHRFTGVYLDDEVDELEKIINWSL
jgi:DNA segregation ATPase FtsK/SpoIIIE-like protein